MSPVRFTREISGIRGQLSVRPVSSALKKRKKTPWREKKLPKRLAVRKSRRTFAAANEKGIPLRRGGYDLRSLARQPRGACGGRPAGRPRAEQEFFERLAIKTK